MTDILAPTPHLDELRSRHVDDRTEAHHPGGPGLDAPVLIANRTRHSIGRGHEIGMQHVISPLGCPVHRPVQIHRCDVRSEVDLSARQPTEQDVDEAGPVQRNPKTDPPFDLNGFELAQPPTAGGLDPAEDGGGADGPQRRERHAATIKHRNGIRPRTIPALTGAKAEARSSRVIRASGRVASAATAHAIPGEVGVIVMCAASREPEAEHGVEVDGGSHVRDYDGEDAESCHALTLGEGRSEWHEQIGRLTQAAVGSAAADDAPAGHPRTLRTLMVASDACPPDRKIARHGERHDLWCDASSDRPVGWVSQGARQQGAVRRSGLGVRVDVR